MDLGSVEARAAGCGRVAQEHVTGGRQEEGLVSGEIQGLPLEGQRVRVLDFGAAICRAGEVELDLSVVDGGGQTYGKVFGWVREGVGDPVG